MAQRGERFGAAYVIEILRGARTERILNRGHETLSVYGIGKDLSVEDWRSLARSLIHQRLVDQTQDGYSVLSLNESSRQVLRGERAFHLAKAAKPSRAAQPDRARMPDSGGAAQDEAAFSRLRRLRKQLADSQGLPPYVIFHDATLREMAARRPRTLSQLADIRGIGEAKLQRYGEQFIAVLHEESQQARPDS